MVTETVTPRIAPLAPPYAPEIAELLSRMMPPGVEPIALFRIFAKNQPMAAAMTTWGGYELGRTLSLSMRDREIAIDRTCARCGCEYEWGVHIAFFARRVGLGPAEVRSLTHGSADDNCWSDRDRLLIQATDAFHDAADLGDDLWCALAVELTESELLDLALLCGWYHAISFVARSARVPLEDGAPRFADVV